MQLDFRLISLAVRGHFFPYTLLSGKLLFGSVSTNPLEQIPKEATKPHSLCKKLKTHWATPVAA